MSENTNPLNDFLNMEETPTMFGGFAFPPVTPEAVPTAPAQTPSAPAQPAPQDVSPQAPAYTAVPPAPQTVPQQAPQQPTAPAAAFPQGSLFQAAMAQTPAGQQPVMQPVPQTAAAPAQQPMPQPAPQSAPAPEIRLLKLPMHPIRFLRLWQGQSSKAMPAWWRPVFPGTLCSSTERQKFDEATARVANTDTFLAAVRKYTKIKKLTPRILAELIDHIEVHQAEIAPGGQIQKIVIFYNCIGSIEIPEEVDIPLPQITMKTRQSVAVTYDPLPLATV